jgi:hypothetical protein
VDFAVLEIVAAITLEVIVVASLEDKNATTPGTVASKK